MNGVVMPDRPADDPAGGPVVGQVEPIYQPRCVHCYGEHYAMNVPAVSHGESGCHLCGRTAPVFYSEAAYRAALREACDRMIRRRRQVGG